MIFPLKTKTIFSIAFVLLAMLTPTASPGETFVGSTNDSRIVIAFKVPEKAAQARIPEGWTISPVAKGPLKGSNLLVVLIDRHLNLDAQGKPAKIPQYRAVALVSPASQPRSKTTRLYITRVYVTDASLNAYKNSIGADIQRKATYSVGDNAATGSETWSVKTGSGKTMSFQMEYSASTPSYVEGQSLPYSNIEPEFHRIYRYKQLTTLLLSVSR